VNPISKVTSAIFHPVQTATTVAGQALGVAAAGARATMHIIDRAAGQGRGDTSTGWSTSAPAATQGGFHAGPTTDATPRPGNAGSSAEAPASSPAADKASAKKATRRAPSARAATVGPALSQPAREAIEDDEVRTPSGIRAAGEGHNPDTTETDLHQPDTEPLMDPATVKSVRSEAEVMQRGADVDKG
jgi:hypothetical protein